MNSNVVENRVKVESVHTFSESKPDFKIHKRKNMNIVRDVDEFSDLTGEWDDLVDEAGAHIFQTHDWLCTWWKYFAETSDLQKLHILMFYHEDRLVGIAPFFIDSYKWGNHTWYRCLRLIGSKVMKAEDERTMGQLTYTDYLDLIISPGFEQYVFNGLLEHFRNTDEFDEIIMEEVPEYSTLLTDFIPLLEEETQKWNVSVEDSSVCPVTELKPSWDEFLKGLSSNARYQIRRSLKRTKDESDRKVFDIEQVENEEDIEPAYNRLVSFHQDRWNERGRPGTFAEQRMYNFYKEIIFRFHHRGWLQLQQVTVPEENGESVAIDLLFRYKNTIYMIQRGFDQYSPYAEYGPGNSLLYSVLEEASGSEIEKYDFLRGDEGYKFRAATKVVQNKNIHISKRSSGARLSVFNRVVRPSIKIKKRLMLEGIIIKTHAENNGVAGGTSDYLKDLKKRIALKLEAFTE